jgi:transcriptional regulator with XRE-family HTH domain
MLSSELVELLIERRHELKLTQSVLARKMGVSRQYMSDLEMEKCTNPTLNNFAKWLKALKIEAKIGPQGVTLTDLKKGL